MVINLSSLPKEIIDKFRLMAVAHDGHIYIEIQKGMYGLPQAGILKNELLQQRLVLDGYRPTEHTHGLWKHKTWPVWFSLVVDDLGIKHIGRDIAEQLMAAIKKNYDISSDWTGSAYCSFKIDWDYTNGTDDLSMPGYIKVHYISIIIQHPRVLKMHHTSGIRPYMVPKHRM
jgi:hypothetical protein